MPGDRRFAITHQSSVFNPQAPSWVSRGNFLVVARSPSLAVMQCHYDNNATILTSEDINSATTNYDLTSDADRILLEQELDVLELRSQPGPYKVVEVPGVSLTDSPTQTISLFNKESLLDLEAKTAESLDARRFRGNIWISGVPAWEEFDWVGKCIDIAGVQLLITERIQRCAATNANPETGKRDSSIPTALRRHYGHADFGVLAKVVNGGIVSVDAEVNRQR